MRKKFADGRLCGSARKRIFTWMKFGKSFQEALALCKTRLRDVPEYIERKKAIQMERAKRFLPKKPDESEVPKQARHPALWRAPKPGTEITRAFKVIIKDTSGPLSEEQADSIQKTILERINLDDKEDGPRFLGCLRRIGGLQVTCANMDSKDWLLQQLPTLKPWETANLVVAGREKKLIATSFIPDAQIEEEPLINLLKTQNKELNFSEWTVVARKPELSGQIVTFSFDEDSLRPLYERKFYLFLGLGKILIRMKKKNSEKGIPIQLPELKEEKQEQMNAQVNKSEPGGSKRPATKSSRKKKKNRPGHGRGPGSGIHKRTTRSQNWIARKKEKQN